MTYVETTHCSNGTVKWNYHNSYGYYTEGNYDGFLTFTFASDKVSDDVLSFWLGQKNRTCENGSLYYDNGFMKASYGSFIEGLDVIYCSDLCADIAALRFNVSWERTGPMVMSVRDDMLGTVLSGECGFYFGRTAYGNPDDVKSFYFACSSSFSPIEHYVSQALFPNEGNNGSATVGLGFILDCGGDIEIISDGDLTLIREVGSNEKILLFDSAVLVCCVMRLLSVIMVLIVIPISRLTGLVTLLMICWMPKMIFGILFLIIHLWIGRIMMFWAFWAVLA